MIRVFEPRLTFQNKLDVFLRLIKIKFLELANLYQILKKHLKYFDREYGVALSNGSTALEVALKLPT